MDITYKRYSNTWSEIVFSSYNTVIEDSITHDEAVELAVRFFEDVVSDGLDRTELVRRLLELEIVDEEMLKEYFEEKETTDTYGW